jgi:phage terminase large subunit
MRLTSAYNKILELHGRYRIVQGGMRAGKTFAILQYLVAIAEECDDIIITVTSNFTTSLRLGAMRDFKKILLATKHYKYFEENKTTHTFTCKATGSIIEFVGLDEELKARGASRHILFVNEANRISFDVFDSLAKRTSGFIILDYNPSSKFWVHKELLDKNGKPKPGNSFEILTYLDNEECPPAIRAEIEAHPRDTNWWKVYGLGQTGEVEGNIYRGWEFISQDELPEEKEFLGYGMDFGFAPDPCALVSLWRIDNKLLAIEEWLQNELTPDQIVAKTIMTTTPNTLIIADNARPEIIAQMRAAGLQVIPCVKQENIGGVLSGVSNQLEMMAQEKFIACGDYLEEEYMEYKYVESKDGKFTTKIPKGKDHLLDALRYVWYYVHREYILEKAIADDVKEY